MAYSQEKDELTIKEAIQLALENHPQLKVSSKEVLASRQQIKIARLDLLPTIEGSAQAEYLGTPFLLDKNFSKTKKVSIPHFGNNYAVQASQLLFNAGLVKKSIQLAMLDAQLSQLSFDNDIQSIKFLVASNYLDLKKAINQKQVYQNNLDLTNQKLDLAKKFYNQGMVTKNNIIRGELILKNFELEMSQLNNDIATIKYNLDIAMGRDLDADIVPVEEVKDYSNPKSLEYFMDLAINNNPQLKSSQKNVAIADKNIEITRAQQAPSISLVSGYTATRPVTSSTPPLDMYLNSWQVGASLSYNIDNLYKARTKIHLKEIEKSKSEDSYNLTLQNTKMDVNTSYRKYILAIKNASIKKDAQELAQENYNIIDAKYRNQLALQVEMTDAINSKLEADLDYSNAQLDVMYQYYSLLKSTGSL